MRRRKYPKSIVYSIVSGIVMAVIFCLPWYGINGESHTAFGVLKLMADAGGVSGFCSKVMHFTAEEIEIDAGLNAQILMILCIFQIVLLIAELLNILRRFRRIHGRRLDAAVLVCTSVLAILLTNVDFVDTKVVFYVFLADAAALAAFFGRKLIESSEEDEEQPTIAESWKNSFQNFQKWRKREKQHNSPEFYKVIFKNFKSNARTFILFFSSAAVSVMMIFMMMAMKFMLDKMTGGQTEMIGEGLAGIIQNAVLVIGAVCMFLMAFSLKFYMDSRTRDYGIFLVLGIRHKTLQMLMALEYAGSLVISVITGLLGGSVGAVILRMILMKYYPQAGAIAWPGLKVYGAAALVSILLFGISASINYDVYVETDLGNTLTKQNAKDRMPAKRKLILLAAGVVFTAAAFMLYTRRVFFEDVKLVFICGAGCYLILRYGGSIVLQMIRNHEKSYYRHILPLNQLYYRFKNNVNYMFAIFVLDVFILFYFALQVIGNIPGDMKKICPYDVICRLDEEESDYFEHFEEEYQAKAVTVPMLRLTVPDITPKREDPKKTSEIPQGQQIGLSESSYQMLTGKIPGLAGREIFISYQQSPGDNAHPLDFGSLFPEPHIRIGLPTGYDYLFRKDVFPQDYTLKGEERNPFIGRLSKGYQENVVVFSDAYFEQEYPDAEGEKYLVLLTIPEENQEQAVKELEASIGGKYDGEVKYDSTLKRVDVITDIVKNIQAEQLLGLLVNVLLILALVFGNIFIQFVRAAADIPAMRKRYEFLKCMGIHEGENQKALLQEFSILRLVPLTCALIISGLFWAVTARLRAFDGAELKLFLGWEAVILAAYLIVQAAGSVIMLRYMWKEIHKK